MAISTQDIDIFDSLSIAAPAALFGESPINWVDSVSEQGLSAAPKLDDEEEEEDEEDDEDFDEDDEESDDEDEDEDEYEDDEDEDEDDKDEDEEE
jgi:hypothetical protein